MSDVSIDEMGQKDLEAAESDKEEFLEFLGTDKQFGTEFYPYDVPGHTVTRKQLRDAWDIETPKDLTWTKPSGGPHRNRMLVPVGDLSPEALEALENDPMFKRVTL